jgi:hypothetical protein
VWAQDMLPSWGVTWLSLWEDVLLEVQGPVHWLSRRHSADRSQAESALSSGFTVLPLRKWHWGSVSHWLPELSLGPETHSPQKHQNCGVITSHTHVYFDFWVNLGWDCVLDTMSLGGET